MLDDLLGLEPELELHVDRARREDDVHACARCDGERLDGGVEVLVSRPRERRDGGRLTAAATARTPSKSPGEEAANPASITSTPSASSAWAISTFSSGARAMPGDCSPSLRVVSRIVILRCCTGCSFGLGPPGGRTSSLRFGRCVRPAARERVLPLEGENQEQLDARTTAAGYGHGRGVNGYGEMRPFGIEGQSVGIADVVKLTPGDKLVNRA